MNRRITSGRADAGDPGESAPSRSWLGSRPAASEHHKLRLSQWGMMGEPVVSALSRRAGPSAVFITPGVVFILRPLGAR